MFVVAADCDQCQDITDPRRGNVDRVSDVVVVDAPDGHSYAVFANPELLHLRVLDLTTGRFLRAPNRFFPLSVAVGSETRTLAVAVDRTTEAVDPTRVFALDNADDTVFVVATADDTGPIFTVQAEVPVPRAPGALAAIRDGDVTILAVTSPRDGAMALVSIDDAGAVSGTATVDLRANGRDDAQPESVVASTTGTAFIVGDAVRGEVSVIEVDAALTVTDVRHVDVLGPVSALAAGIVDVGDGLAPVVVALRSDVPAVMLVRLHREGFREERVALLGGAALPSLPIAAYVPDARPSAAPVTVCCRGLSAERVAAGEATASFAGVTLADGRLLYVQLAASHIDGAALPDGRTVVRLVDDDAAPLSAPDGVDLNTSPELWVPADGGFAFRPTITLTAVDNFGTPPLIPLLSAGASLLLVWEGELPRARALTGAFSPATRGFDSDGNLLARDVRAGDIARLIPESQRLDCASAFEARILDVTALHVTLAMEGDVGDDPLASPFITVADATSCLQGAGDVRLTVVAGDAFVVTEGARDLGRLRFTDDDENTVDLPGVRLTIAQAAAGKPLRNSRLAIPFDAHVLPLGLDIPAVAGNAGRVPTSITGGTVTIPDAQNVGEAIPARRMVMTAGGNSIGVAAEVFTCDEAETSLGRLERLR